MKFIYSTNNEYALEFIECWKSHFEELFSDGTKQIMIIDNEPDDLNVIYRFNYREMFVELQYISGCSLWFLSVQTGRCEKLINRLPLANDEVVLNVVSAILNQIEY